MSGNIAACVPILKPPLVRYVHARIYGKGSAMRCCGGEEPALLPLRIQFGTRRDSGYGVRVLSIPSLSKSWRNFLRKL